MHPTLAQALKKAAHRARIGKRITVHTLRHSFATAYLENGGSIHKLKELLGHAHLQTTEIRSPLDALPTSPNIIPFTRAA